MEHYEGDNIGGLYKVELIHHTKVLSLNPLALVPGASWENIPFKEQSGQLQPKTRTSDNGPVYSYSGRFFIHRMRNDVDATMKPFIGENSIMRLTDMNERTYIIGQPDAPAQIYSDGDTGRQYPNENGTAYVFSIEQASEAIITD